MTEFHESQLSSYFELVEKWRDAYKICRLHVLGSRNKNNLEIISARIVLDIGGDTSLKAPFTCRDIEAHQVSIGAEHKDIFSVVRLLAAGKAVEIEGIGHLVLPSTEHNGIFVSPPNFLHPEGVNDGNRIAVLSVNGAATDTLLVQPDLDWKLKAADTPYDSIQELSIDYGLGPLRGNRALLEVVARTAVQVLARSNVRGTKGVFGIYLASQLDLRDCKLGLRVLHQAKVVRREVFRSTDLSWQKGDDGLANVGVVEIDIPVGAIVQCIASYAEEAHHIQWRADPSTLLNPRAAVLSQVDPSRSLLRSYLLPELPPRGRAADDFEAAVAWLLWALGFSVASFGDQPKTRDSFDVIATSPRGDFMVVECTLGLLRAESKLSKLAARAVGVRDTFVSANMKHLRVLPVIVTAMSREQISADLPAASDLEILVITREDLERSINEFLVFPDADALFDQGIQSVQERKAALKLGAAAA